ncbi:hypothetical protein WKW77_34495 [Variovorax ureilyticus]|uniref:Lipoprotein n=1 Tax=Variovorax ureilyticus TaxID=1836198 RepID=A0ABU8VRA1_9BURK
MNNYLNRVLEVSSALTLVGLTGCAGVDFYQDKKLENATGIPIYGAKPYVLVVRTGAESKPVESSIVYITDPSQIIYAKPKSGFGTAKLTLGLTGGQMTSFGQETDVKVPELLNSVAGLITARAGAAKTAADAAAVLAGITTKQAAPVATDVAKKTLDIADDITKKLDANQLDLIDPQKQTLRSAAAALRIAGNTLNDPAKAPQHAQQYEVIKAQREELAKLPKPTGSTSRDKALQTVQDWVTELGKLVKATEPPKEPQPDFELYEIVQDIGQPIKLRRVVPQ